MMQIMDGQILWKLSLRIERMQRRADPKVNTVEKPEKSKKWERGY